MKIPDSILEKARHADLVEYLKLCNYDLKKEGHNYRVVGYSGLIVKGYQWYWMSECKGGKAVDFLVEVLGMSFQEAVEELTSGNISYLPDEPSLRPELPFETNHFQLPERAKNEKRVIAYLCQQRKISYDIVIKLIQDGKLYQDKMGNCTFIITDRNGRAIGTESHGTVTYSRYKSSTRHTGYGFTLISGIKPIGAMFFESAIDLLSYYQLFKQKLTHHALISIAGVGNFQTIQQYHNEHPENKICLCCDNDQAGNNLIEKVRQEFDNQVYVHRPKFCKDWNEFLINK